MSRQTAPGRAAEDYLEALLLLERGTGDVRGAQLARHLGVSKASVSIAMKRLKQEGYVSVAKGRDLLLTDAGRAIACRVYERHCFFTQLLLCAGVEPEQAEQDACRMEHVVSAQTIQHLYDYLSRQEDGYEE